VQSGTGSDARARGRGFVKGGLRWEESAGSVCCGGQSSVQGKTGHRGVGGAPSGEVVRCAGGFAAVASSSAPRLLFPSPRG
jgi:hypothetical protein